MKAAAGILMPVSEVIGSRNIRVTPEFLIQGGGNTDSGALMIQALLANMLKKNPNALVTPGTLEQEKT
jgi:hypothetical protein